MGKEEVIITGKGMFPIRTNRVSYYKDHRFKALSASQKGKPWPDVPVVKDGVVTRYDEFLKSTGSAKSAEAEEPEPEPVAKPSLSQRAAVTGPRSYDPPEFGGYLDQGVAGYGYFEDPRETVDDEETAEDRQLTQAIQTVKAPNFADNLSNLLNLATISPESEPELADLAHRLSPDELVNRLMPLFSGKNVKISGHSLRGA
ncbi:hypothetical protein [uncultured Ruegeria sp.]|uniref:hypothetical protein n=1 Tax=uncultured Ruegeria sp. TaxID=259304 RepID=UPI00262B5EB7|nr:hypothetical protein [uncultured Ruegeria sp.]